jgi:cyclomaltodextrinase / maltogenic alpha-amylase / neopullulanase
MNETIFGTLSTLDQRVDYLRRQGQGVRHDNRLLPTAPGPHEAPQVLATVGLARRIARVECVLTEPETAVIPLAPVQPAWNVLNWQYVQSWAATLPPRPAGALVRYQICAYPADGGAPIWADDGATFSYFVGNPAQPAWAAEAVVYQIFPDRFYPGHGRTWNPTTDLNAIHGGTLRGIIDKLDYIADLGCNCLWINPFFPDESHHGYHATDYFSVDPGLGTLEDVRALVDAAHARGIRLLLDFVANHWGSGHPSFQAALADRRSPTYDWYKWIEWPEQYETFFGVKDLPQLNVDHPAVRAELLRSVQFWLADVGFDGLRLDYAQGPSRDFWTDLRALMYAVKPTAWVFGEVVETPTLQRSFEGRFSGCLDFMLAEALRATFAFGRMDLAAFDNFLHLHRQFFPPAFSRPAFLDNHDMNRFLFLVDGDARRLKLAALCLFTLEGQPVLYNGAELGVSQDKAMDNPAGYGMAECRRPMPWEDGDWELHAYFKWLIHFRRAHPALWRGARRTLHLDAQAGTYAYACSDGRETVIVALNLSDEARRIALPAQGDTPAHAFDLPAWGGDVHVVERVLGQAGDGR